VARSFTTFTGGSGFLPSKFQGGAIQGQWRSVLYLSNPDGMSRQVRRGLLDDLAKLNEEHYAEFADPEIQTRISQLRDGLQGCRRACRSSSIFPRRARRPWRATGRM